MGLNSAPATPEDAWRSTAMILGSLPVGVTLFAAIAVWLRSGQTPEDLSLFVIVWLALGLLESVAGVVIWRRAVRPHILSSGFASNPDQSSWAGLQTGLTICMALAEGVALFGVIIHLIGGPRWPAIVSVVIAWAALLIVWPRRAWYGLR